MVARHVIETTIERLHETEEAIEAQRTYVASVSDPVAKATATHTLETLEEIRCIMERTRDLLVERETGRSSREPRIGPGRSGPARTASQRQGRAADLPRHGAPRTVCAR